MKHNKIFRIFATILSVFVGIAIPSCDNDDEPMGWYPAKLNIFIEDEEGNDVVAAWVETPKDEKINKIEFKYFRTNGHNFTEKQKIRVTGSLDSGKSWIWLQDEFVVTSDESESFTIYLFEGDEGIEFKGEWVGDPKPQKITSGQKVIYKEVQWTFKDTVLSAKHITNVTLIRSSDGKYTLKSAD